jgi:hypothetical protein
VSRGRKEQRHACSVIGTQQYKRPIGQVGERETNAPNLFKAPQAAEERETNTPCQGETAENTGTRETNVSEKDTAAVRRDGRPPAIAEQQQRQEVATAVESATADELPNQTQRGTTIMDTLQTAGLDPGDGAKTGGCRPNISDTSRAGTPASQASRGGSTSRSRCLRRQLTQLLKEGSECFNPDEVRRIVQAARAGPEGSLTAICMPDNDIALFMHAFPEADDRELRAHCLSTLLEYEESMRAWEEAKNSGDLDSDSTDSEDELTGIELLRDLDLPAPRATTSTAPTARPGHIEWPKRVLRQTILVSSTAAEIESNIDWADWDADCFEECRRLLQQETKQMWAISDDRGPEEIPVLVDFEVQHWIAEALESATHATGLIIGRVASIGMHRPNLGRKEAGALDLAASRATQTVMRAATANPLSDAQLEQIVKLAFGKRVPIAPAAAEGGDPPQATTPAVEPSSNHQAEREVESEDEGESHATDHTGPEESPPAMGRMRPASPGLQRTVALPSSGTPTKQPSGGAPSAKAAATTQGGKKKNKAARGAARAALEAEGGSPAADGGQAPSARRSQQCPVFGCTREHAPSDCPTFLDMTPKERLDLVHAKRLCLLCLQHPSSTGCEAAGKRSNCPADGCDRPHHVTLHGALKARKASPPARGADPPDEPTAASASRVPEMAKQLRGLLEGLGIDPNALEVRIRVWKPGEPGRPYGGEATDPSAAGAGEGRLTSKLLEALTSLCRAGERFAGSAGEGGRRMIETADPIAFPRGNAHGERSRLAARSMERTSRRSGSRTARRELTVQDGEDSADEVGERRRTLESSEYARGNQGSLERYGGLQRVVVLTPDGGQLINMGIGRGFIFSVVSQKTTARYAVHRSKLPTPLMVDGPSNQQVRATELCTIAFPQEKAVGKR